jgi:hypothetical protein
MHKAQRHRVEYAKSVLQAMSVGMCNALLVLVHNASVLTQQAILTAVKAALELNKPGLQPAAAHKPHEAHLNQHAWQRMLLTDELS